MPIDPENAHTRTANDLAIFSGSPAYEDPLHVGRPNIGDRDVLLRRFGEVLNRRWLTNDGPLVQEFEARVAALTGAAECVAVTNATVALELLVRALGLSGEVILPSWTFIGTAHAMTWLGLRPVFVDVDPSTHNLQPEAVAAAVTPETSAILAVHLWGRPCDARGLTEIAADAGVRLIFDAAHALGCSYEGAGVGGLGDASVFSFHATKIANAAEGGVITTGDPELAASLRRMRNFGFEAYDRARGPGTNAKMNELSAAMGLTSLDDLDRFIEIAERNYDAYRAALDSVPGTTVLEYAPSERHNYHYVVVELDSDSPLTRDELVAVLHAENVLARRYFYPGCHRMDPYAEGPISLPHTETLAGRVLVLPTGTAVSPADVTAVASIVRVALENAAAVRERLQDLRDGDS